MKIILSFQLQNFNIINNLFQGFNIIRTIIEYINKGVFTAKYQVKTSSMINFLISF